MTVHHVDNWRFGRYRAGRVYRGTLPELEAALPYLAEQLRREAIAAWTEMEREHEQRRTDPEATSTAFEERWFVTFQASNPPHAFLARERREGVFALDIQQFRDYPPGLDTSPCYVFVEDVEVPDA